LLLIFSLSIAVLLTGLAAQTGSFHNAPASSAGRENPYQGDRNMQAGQKLYTQQCAVCHGSHGEGTGNIAALAHGPAQTAKPGEIFWYITRGDVANGMPSWASLAERQRWQIVSYIKAMPTAAGARLAAAAGSEAPKAEIVNAPPPTPPFTDFRF
jgi:mono/diheme cytochrome c family protein